MQEIENKSYIFAFNDEIHGPSVRNIKNPLDRYIELKTQRWIYEKQTSIKYESSSQWLFTHALTP